MDDRALVRKIQRRLHDFEKLRKARPNSREYREFGPYYVTDENKGIVVASKIDDLQDFYNQVAAGV